MMHAGLSDSGFTTRIWWQIPPLPWCSVYYLFGRNFKSNVFHVAEKMTCVSLEKQAKRRPSWKREDWGKANMISSQQRKKNKEKLNNITYMVRQCKLYVQLDGDFWFGNMQVITTSGKNTSCHKWNDEIYSLMHRKENKVSVYPPFPRMIIIFLTKCLKRKI